MTNEYFEDPMGPSNLELAEIVKSGEYTVAGEQHGPYARALAHVGVLRGKLRRLAEENERLETGPAAAGDMKARLRAERDALAQQIAAVRVVAERHALCDCDAAEEISAIVGPSPVTPESETN